MGELRILHPGQGDGRQPWLRPVDFAAPSSVPPDQQARLRRMAEELGPLVSPKAMNDLGLAMTLEPLWIEELLWRDAHPIPAEDAVGLTVAASSGGHLHLIVDPAIATLVAERMLGTEPDPARPLRAVTAIDRSLLGRLGTLLVGGLGRLWEEATGETLALKRTATLPQIRAAGDPTEPTLLLAIEARLFDTFSVMHVLLPRSVTSPVGPALSRPSSRAEAEDAGVAHALHARLGGAGVDVRVQLGRVRMTAGDVGRLAPGDRVALDSAATEPAALLVDGVPVGFGHVGRSGVRRAVRIGAGPVGA